MCQQVVTARGAPKNPMKTQMDVKVIFNMADTGLSHGDMKARNGSPTKSGCETDIDSTFAQRRNPTQMLEQRGEGKGIPAQLSMHRGWGPPGCRPPVGHSISASLLTTSLHSTSASHQWEMTHWSCDLLFAYTADNIQCCCIHNTPLPNRHLVWAGQKHDDSHGPDYDLE
jgi:hypothetical protein